VNVTDATSLPAIHRVAVIGAGRIGRSFALACAAAGFDVVLEDVMPANLRRAQEEYAELTAAHGTLTLAPSIEEAVREADLVVDFVPDELESKLEIFCLLDRMAPPKTILLTPSDAQSITDLASCTYRGDRCFAVRGVTSCGESVRSESAKNSFEAACAVRLLHPANASQSALDSVGEFLRKLGSDLRVEIDTDVPQLVKNFS
jgi:3-hydroxybutyryl-CoA dehydrogenase